VPEEAAARTAAEEAAVRTAARTVAGVSIDQLIIIFTF